MFLRNAGVHIQGTATQKTTILERFCDISVVYGWTKKVSYVTLQRFCSPPHPSLRHWRQWMGQTNRQAEHTFV